MALSNKEKERLIRCVEIIDLQVAAIRDIVGTDWITVSTTQDGYIRVEMYDYDEAARTSTNVYTATRLNEDTQIWLREAK